jgi:clan AA aspartic protease (TIGR02281 family)
MADDDLSRLTDDEKTALTALLKRTIDDDRYPLSLRIGTLRGILAAQDKMRGKVLAFCASLFVATLQPCAAETIQLEGQHGTYMVPVSINHAVTLPFVLDTGASAVAIPEDVFLTLTRSGTVTTSDFLGTGTVQLADGSEHASKRFVLHEVQIGNHVVRNVIANVVSVKGNPLLGQSFLSRLPAWSIDNQSHSLVLHDQSGVTAPPVTTSRAAPPASTPYGYGGSGTTPLTDEKLNAVAAAIRQVATIRQSYESKIAAASDKQRLVKEANDAMAKAVTDQGLSVDEYNSIISTAQNDPAVRQNIAQRIRHTSQ